MKDFPRYGMAPVRETAYTATRNYGRFVADLPDGFEPASYDPSNPATWAKAAAQQQAWHFDQGHPDPEWPWEMARKFPSDQHDGGDDDLCETRLSGTKSDFSTLNKRRCELINKRLEEGLTYEETKELLELQDLTREHLSGLQIEPVTEETQRRRIELRKQADQ